MRTKLFLLLLLLLTGCSSIKDEYTYYSGNGVKVYHCTNREHEVGDTLKSNVIKRATYRDHLLD